ncbi:(2Fe-2S)-binding protein [Actinokineospora inagensis]|uniref:(2Fe-2S)-binding protein n=1 Tax=Actinokineospora inagensis TaxID=103730 RepID=UPI0004103E67|nr:(2Fe-2S)-binding protein [Actinokineospora inagensis]
MNQVREVYAAIAARLPYHVGAGASGHGVPVAAVGDPKWISDQVDLAGKLYRHGDRRTLGVLWWYSASVVVPAPTVESLVVTGSALDPAAVRLYPQADGRILAATADALCSSPGSALRDVFQSAIDAVSAVTGARARTLWAIAADSLANRVLWTGGRPELALSLADDMHELPKPRFVSVNGRDYVRRGSCCLVYETGAAKCVSCPRQRPEERSARLSAL